MPKKVIDISLIKENENDLTFFKIDDEEINETLKALKKTYITANSKEETILKLKNNHSKSEKNSKQLKLESYKKYNEALNMLNRNFINSALSMIEEALEINPKDVDILNLKGLVKLLKCNFDEAFESFHKSLCYGNDELSKKYLQILSSEEFSIFLSRYNHAIRFINKDLNEESIQIFENITHEESDLIEPYFLLYLIYEKVGNTKKAEDYLNTLKNIEKDNQLIELKADIKQNIEKNENIEKNSKSKKNKYIYILIIIALVIGVGLLYANNKKQMDKLNSQISQKEEKLNEASDKLDEANNKLEEANGELDEIKSTQEENQQKEAELIVASEEELFKKAIDFKSQGNNEKSIEYFEAVVENGKTKKYISESVYQVAMLNEKLKHDEEAIKYYRKYINTYTKSDNYYDDCFYNIGMIYYNNGDLESAKKELYSLRAEDPDSIYNNSKIDSILKEK